MLGIYARSDTERGVFKAPANEIVRGALELENDINDNSQGQLNPRGVNAIRQFPGRGIRIWGARTMSSNALWKYVSVRRLFIFLERSIYENTQWVVFEPNDPRLWARVTDTIRLFLRSQWRQGALFGRTEEQAFFITCDETTMTQDDILNGRLICEIGIAPVRPAEFVVFRVFQHTAEAQR
jgi:phage tail sheath protein FI